MAQSQKPRAEHVEKASRILHSWTPSKVRQAKLMADGGNLMLVADLCEDIMADDSMMSTLGVRSSGFVGSPLTFEPNGDKRRSSAVIKALEQDWWHANPEIELKQVWNWAVLLGVAPAELVNREVNGRVIPRIKHWHPRWLRYDWEARGWKIQTNAGEVGLNPGDGQWMLFTPFGSRRPWAMGAWRAVALWWLLKQYALTDWARYSERHGGGILAGTIPVTAQGDAKARKELAEDLADLGSDASVALPPGYDLKIVEATADTWKTFQAQIQMADEGVAVAILGQNLTTRVSSGSLAAAKVQNDVRGDLKRGDAEVVSTTTREQQLIFWAEWNFGNRDLAPWAKWDTRPPEDLKTKAETFDKIGDALGKLKAVGVKTAPLLEQFGLEPEDTQPPAPAPTQPQSNAASRFIQLANGIGSTARDSSAFLEGQLYADALGDQALKLDMFQPDRSAVLQALEKATDYEDLRSRLLDVFDGMNPDHAQELIARMLILAAMNGQFSAAREVPDLALEAE